MKTLTSLGLIFCALLALTNAGFLHQGGNNGGTVATSSVYTARTYHTVPIAQGNYQGNSFPQGSSGGGGGGSGGNRGSGGFGGNFGGFGGFYPNSLNTGGSGGFGSGSNNGFSSGSVGGQNYGYQG